MRPFRRSITRSFARLATGLLIGLSSSGADAQESDSDAHAHCHDCRRLAVQVPATDEITVFDPRVNSEAKPTPIVFQGADGEQQVDIPPAVIVHNYYYSGDRDFRGPRLPGGPSIVVVSHPDTGERQYLEVQMLPGSPRVVYRRDSIDYDFGYRRIHIEFGNPLICESPDIVRVSYRHGHPKLLAGEGARERPHRPIVGWVDRTGLPHGTRHLLRSAHNTLNNSADLVHAVGERVAAPVVRIVEATPLGGITSSRVEEQAIQQRDAALERAERIAAQNDVTIPTNL